MLKKIDWFLFIGIFLSTGISLVLYFLDINKEQSLVIGILGIIIVLLIDIIARIEKAKDNIQDAMKFNKILLEDKELPNIFKNIILDISNVRQLKNELFKKRAIGALKECQDIIHSLSEMQMIVEPFGNYSFGPKGLLTTKFSIKAVSYAKPTVYWERAWAEKYILANRKIIENGVNICRIFLTNRPISETLKKIIERQKKIGIDVRVAFIDEVPKEFHEDYLIQDDNLLVRLIITQEGIEKDEIISIKSINVQEAVKSFERLLAYSYKDDEI